MIRNEQNLENLRELSRRIAAFSRTVYAAHLKRFEHVAEVYDTEKLQGVTLGELHDEFLGQVKTHLDTVNVNVHRTTSGQVMPD